MAEQTAPSGDDPPSYEEARAELIEVVRALEAGGTTLEESLALWERGERLAARVGASTRRSTATRTDHAPPEPPPSGFTR
jgi:exodeoxyribonuclease VII small subunit